MLLAASLAVSLAILETAARLLQLGGVGTPYVREDPDTLYAHIPNVRGRMEFPGEFAVRFEINSQGLRSPELPFERSERPRVVAVGDSFTFGVGAEQHETWPAVLGRALGAEVANGGVQGWGLVEYWIWLEDEGLRYAPDQVVVGVHASDWTSPQRGIASLGDDGALERHPRASPGLDRLKAVTARIPGYRLLMEWSVLASFVKSGVASRLRFGTTQALEGESTESAVDRFDAIWPTNRAVVLAIEESVAAAGARLALVFIPTWEHVLGEPGHEGVEGHFRSVLAAHADERGLALVDMTPRFRALAEASPDGVAALYHQRDGHCTPAGYAEVAGAVAASLSIEAAPGP